MGMLIYYSLAAAVFWIGLQSVALICEVYKDLGHSDDLRLDILLQCLVLALALAWPVVALGVLICVLIGPPQRGLPQ